MSQPHRNPRPAIGETEERITRELCDLLGLELCGVTDNAFYIKPDDRIPGLSLNGMQYFRPFVDASDAKHALGAWCALHGRYARYAEEMRHGLCWTTAGVGDRPSTMVDLFEMPTPLASGLCYLVTLDARYNVLA